jgi:cob(I)alamin adenosyltransferase
MFGAGATDLIRSACDVFLHPGDEALIAGPAFGEYARSARLRGAHVHECRVPVNSTLALDVDALLARIVAVRPSVVFVAAPSSPVGLAVSREELRAVADACQVADALCVIDQSYDPFTTAPLGTPALPGHPAVLHLRSLTKDYAIPGIRAGFCLGPQEIVEAISHVRVPWSTSAPAQAAALAAFLPESVARAARTIEWLRRDAATLWAALTELGIPTVASDTHYFLAVVGDATTFRRRLLEEHGIKVRDCTSFGLPEHVRLAARTPGENAELLRAIAAVHGNVAIGTADRSAVRDDPLRAPEQPSAPNGRKAPVPKCKRPGPYRVPPRERRHGLVLVHTGHGKGKTTAALGVLLRATGRGMRVGMFQFVKSIEGRYGEHIAAERLGVEITPLGDGFTWLSENIAEDRALAERAWEICRDALRGGEYDVLVFDELTYPLTFGWLDVETVLGDIRDRPVGTHVIITGRDAHPALIAMADLVTEMRLVKHPYREQGIGAQAGLEL